MAKIEKQTWLMGAMDGIMAESIAVNGELYRAGALDPIKGTINGTGYEAWFGNCFERYDFDQLKAVFEKKLENNPESWHVPAALTFRHTMMDFCKPISMPAIRSLEGKK